MANDLSDKKTTGRVTILDVAAAAGVSKSTVSRILDERLPRASNPTADRVRQVAAELGYVRDVSAANLRRGTSLTLGMIVPRLTDTVMAMLYESFARACARRGRFAIVATTDDRPEAVRAAADSLFNRGVDGLVLATTRTDDDFATELTNRGIPFVLALRGDGHSAASLGDDALGGWLATRHLIDLGHRHIALIAGPEHASNARGRVAGYHRAMAEAGLTVHPSWVVPSGFSIEAGADAVQGILTLYPRPTAVFAVNDNTAIGAMSAIQRAGLKIPDDISLVGYNDIPLVSHLPMPLTSVRVPFDQIAAGALDLLLAGSATEQRIATPTLIPRATTAAPKR
ncbi:LacI family DNA-binding transcriptional regulator [Pararhodobacter sp.]|uniref:LacI family DNA-binding transcriptional regulator n=1 Tax=Pararhodobacter sp. TaxID=2127056 RepID=UPI002FE32385